MTIGERGPDHRDGMWRGEKAAVAMMVLMLLVISIASDHVVSAVRPQGDDGGGRVVEEYEAILLEFASIQRRCWRHSDGG
jgi:hypothetical protein